MLDIEAMLKQEKRSIAVDALFVGFYIAVLCIMRYTGSEWYWCTMVGAGIGARLTAISSRFRVMHWMGLVQRQEAVIELLTTVVESTPQPVVSTPKNGIN